MSGDAAAGLHSDFRWREVDLVVKHHDIGKAELVEIGGLADRAPGFVHEGARQQQENLLAAKRSFGCDALETSTPWREPMALGNLLHHHKTDVVAVADVTGTGIAEPDEELHGFQVLRRRNPRSNCGDGRAPASVT